MGAINEKKWTCELFIISEILYDFPSLRRKKNYVFDDKQNVKKGNRAQQSKTEKQK